MARSVITGAVLMALLASPTVPATAATHSTGEASAASVLTTLEGVVVPVADGERGVTPEDLAAGHAHHGHAHADSVEHLLELPDGALVPVAGEAVAHLDAGSTVVAEVAVPTEVVEAAIEGEPVSTATVPSEPETAVVPRAELSSAEPAPADSVLSEAAVAEAVATGEPLVVEDVRVEEVAEPADVATPSSHVTVVVAQLGDGDVSRYTDTEVDRLISEASRYWREQSDDRISFVRKGVVTRYSSTISCSNYSSLWNEAASRSGFRSTAMEHLAVFVPPDSPGCSYGLGTVGSTPTSGGRLYATDRSWPLLAHELGHNLSLSHANRLACAPANDVSLVDGVWGQSCSEASYGDRVDVMSSSSMDASGNVGALGLDKLGLLGTAKRTITGSGRHAVDLAPIGTTGATRALQVVDPRSGVSYTIENRQRQGRDVYGWGGWADGPYGMQYGVRVLRRGADGKTSVVLDQTPSDSLYTWDADLPVKPGDTFRTYAGGLEVRVGGTAPDGTVPTTVSVAAAGETHWPLQPTVTILEVADRAVAGRPLPVSGRVACTGGGGCGCGCAGGHVTLSAAGATLGPAPLDANGGFATTVTPGAAGRTTLLARYAGSAEAAASSAEAVVEVAEPERVTPTVDVVRAEVDGGTEVATVEVAVAVDGSPVVGDVRVRAGAEARTAALTGGRVRVELPVDPAAPQLEVSYLGSSDVLPLTRSVVATVLRGAPGLELASELRARRGESLLLPVVVRGVRRGAVQLSRDGEVLQTEPLVDGRAALTVPTQVPGTVRYTVSYVGAETAGSTSRDVGVTVVATPTGRAQLTSATTVRNGSTSVVVDLGVDGVPAEGTVTLVAGRELGSAALRQGRATFTVRGLPVGGHDVVARYAGNGVFEPVDLRAGRLVVEDCDVVVGHRVCGPQLARYDREGGEGGRLGPPTGALAVHGSGALQRFRDGALYTSGRSTIAVLHPIGTRWLQAGGATGVLGAPTGEQVALKGGSFQPFAKGAVYTSSRGTYVVKHGVLRDKWGASGWERGRLGFPVADERALKGGSFQAFQGGSIYVTAKHGARAVLDGPIRSAWGATGWEGGRLGYPTRDQVDVKGGSYQMFEKGTVYYGATTGGRALTGKTATEYVRYGGPTGRLGFPTTSTYDVRGGQAVDFQHGKLVVTKSTTVTYKRR